MGGERDMLKKCTEKVFFFNICDVITSPEKEKALLITTSQVHVCARAAEFVATSHVDDDVPNSLQLEVLDQEICRLQSAAVWHVLAVRSVSRLGEEPLQGSEDVLTMCAHRGTGVLRAAVPMDA